MVNKAARPSRLTTDILPAGRSRVFGSHRAGSSSNARSTPDRMPGMAENRKSWVLGSADVACRFLGWLIVAVAALLAVLFGVESMLPDTEPWSGFWGVFPGLFVMTMIGLAMALLRPGKPPAG